MKDPGGFNLRLIVIGTAIIALIVGVLVFRAKESKRDSQTVREKLSATNLVSVAGGTSTTNFPAFPPVVSPASLVSAGDGRDTNSIRQWAHNELEVQRMLDENEKIYRRQLVVLQEPVAVVVERNRLTGEPIRELTLPGLDGQTISFSVQRADLEPSGLRGTFYGQVTGRPDSMVTLAFKNNVQAFTILSPSDHLYLDVEPHNPGEVIVKSINLEKYGAGLCGSP